MNELSKSSKVQSPAVVAEEQEALDTLSFDDSVIEKIVAITCREVDGIIEMKGGILSAIQEGFGGTDITKGVDVEVNDALAEIDLAIIMEYGKSAPEIFQELKKVITENVTAMTGLGISSLNVRVVDVMTKEELERRQEKEEERQLA